MRLAHPRYAELISCLSRACLLSGHGAFGQRKNERLTVLSALVKPDAGRVLIDGIELTAMSEKARAEFRRLHVGFVFQSFRLLTGLTAEENIRMSLSMRGIRHNAKLAREALDAVGLADKGHLQV